MLRKMMPPFLAVSLLSSGTVVLKAEDEREFNTEEENETIVISEGETFPVVITGLSADQTYSFANLQEYADYIDISDADFTAQENTFTVNVLREPEEEIVLILCDEEDTEISELRFLASPDVYGLKVNGTLLSSYAEGDTVTVRAEEKKGKRFLSWTSDEPELNGSTSAELTFRMPARPVELTAEYTALYSVTINNGTASVREAAEGETVTVKAGADVSFAYWQGTDSLRFSRDRSSVSFAMPAYDVELTAKAAAPGWQKISGKWYYYDAENQIVKGWKKISGLWYYMDHTGAMVTGWLKDGSKWYYLSASGAMSTGWTKVSGKWYYLDSSGAMVTGWKRISDTWYYLDKSGAMVTGWLKYGGH